MSDDWETSEIHFLVSTDSSLWSHLLDVGELDAETSYWGDGWNAQQSFNLGFTENQRELSKTKDSDYDKVPDNEDADPLDWVVDWKPAVEAAYAIISLDQLNYAGKPIIDSNDPYAEFSASIGDTGNILWNDQIKEISSDGKESWVDRCRVWKSGKWSADIRHVPNTFSTITLSGFYQPDPMTAPPVYEAMTGTASPLNPLNNRSYLRPSAVCGESIVGDGSYLGVVTNLKRVVRTYDDQGNENTEVFLDAERIIGSNNVSTVWTQISDQSWQTKPIGSPPTQQNHPGVKSVDSHDEWEAVFYRAVASPGGALAVLGGNHVYTARKWQIWKASDTPGVGPALWEAPYRSAHVWSWGSQLLIKAVNDDGIAVGERITGIASFWEQNDSVVIENGSERVLPKSSGAFTYGASICQINKDDTNSYSRLAVGGRSLWVKKDDTWFEAQRPPNTMASIIAIAKNGLMLGSRTIWRNGTSISLDELVKHQKISETNPTPRYTNLRAYAMNGEGAIVALADDSISANPGRKTLLLLAPFEIRDTKNPLILKDDVYIVPKKHSADENSKSIAWIEPHNMSEDIDPSTYDAGDDPMMPQINACLKGLPSELKIEWKFKCKYYRPNGRFLSGDAFISDEVKVPFIEDFPASEVNQLLNGNETWYIHRDYAKIPFFGGDAEISCLVKSGSGDVLMPITTFFFRIAGKNPDNIRARNYLMHSQPDMWYAYAICKHETAEYRYDGKFYNQFVGNPKGKKLFYSKYQKSFNLAYGKPTWNWDFSDSKPGGFGLFQVTGWQGQGNGNVPREVIWNWQKNMDEGAKEIRRDKVPASIKYFNAVKSKYGQNVPEPPLTITGKSRNLTGFEVSVIVRYNGLGGTDMHPELSRWLGKYSQDPWTYRDGAWRGPKANKLNYLNKVIKEIE